jgi:hypothetical protein
MDAVGPGIGTRKPRADEDFKRVLALIDASVFQHATEGKRILEL